MIEINHLDKKQIIVHAFSVTSGSDYTLCGEDCVGDNDRVILNVSSRKKVTCKRCIEVIWMVHKTLPLDCCDYSEVAKNKRLLKAYGIF